MPTDERSRRCGIRDGALQAIGQGGGENYLSAYALLLQASPFQIGLLSSLPQLIGTWAQLLCAKALHRYPRRKSLIVFGAASQAALWLPILMLPLMFPHQGPWLLITCAVAYFAMGHFTVPAWNSLITDLLAVNERGSYFARRARVMAVASFAALCGAGFLLEAGRSVGAVWLGFAAIFLAAAIARIVSILYVAQVCELPSSIAVEEGERFRDFVRQKAGSDFRYFLLFSGLMHVCVLIAGPFFVVYMLRDLHFTYAQYAGWLAAGTLGQFIALQPWGQMSDQFGNRKVLMVTGLIVPVLPMLYVIGTNWWFLIGVNFLGGVVWAGMTLGLQNYVFDAVRPEDRAKGVAVSNTVNAIGWFAGAMIGSWLATILPSEVSLASVSMRPASNLPIVFFISGILRLLVSLSLISTIREPRSVEPIQPRRLLGELPLMKPLFRVFQWTRTRLAS
ncbi:MAG: MFS transporter [Nitrospiraceae bacterium]